jgi:type IX secretion system PorP/SprF family membrane protein
MLGFSSLLTVGFNVGIASKSINPGNLKFPDQFNSTTGFFDAGIPTSVQFNSTTTSYLDMQTGVNYAYFPSDKVYINGGVSIQHFNRARESFFLNTNGFDNRIAPRYIGFVNASLKLNNNIIVNPMGYYSQQANANEIVLGGNLNYNLSGDGVTQLLGGLYYRRGDAVIPMLGFQWNNFRMTFTYDITTSPLKNYNNSRGATEFSLVKYGFYNENNAAMRQSWCPRF